MSPTHDSSARYDGEEGQEKPRKVNPLARSLRLATAAPCLVKPKQGKGSYSRRQQRSAAIDGEPHSE